MINQTQINTLNGIKNIVTQGIAEKAVLNKQLQEKEEALILLKLRSIAIEKARTLLQIAAQKVQSRIEYHISHMVTLALAGVYSEDIQFITKFEARRNTTECDFFFKVGDGEEQDVMDNFGGGVLDVTAFALKVVMLSLKKKLRRILILDEAFRHVSPDLQHNVSEMIKLINEKTGIQILMVSHAEDINDSADKTFRVEKIDNKSIVKEHGWV